MRPANTRITRAIPGKASSGLCTKRFRPAPIATSIRPGSSEGTAAPYSNPGTLITQSAEQRDLNREDIMGATCKLANRIGIAALLAGLACSAAHAEDVGRAAGQASQQSGDAD